MRTLSPEEARRLLSIARADRLEALYVVAITTGLRQGELLGLRWREVDLDDRTLRVVGSLQRIPGQGPTIVEPKTPRSRRLVMLGEEATEALWRHRSRQQEERVHAGSAWADIDLVFTNAVGRPLNPGNVRDRSFEPLLERAALPRLRFHDLRHTAATLLLGAGVHPKVVSEMLGPLERHDHPRSVQPRHPYDAATGRERSGFAVVRPGGCQIGCQRRPPEHKSPGQPSWGR
jgi:integrase